MEILINEIKKKNENGDENGINKSQEFIYYNRKNHHLFLRLKAILYKKKKKPYYRKIVLRLFKYLFIYLEKIQSSTIKIITKHGNKYYYSNKLNIKDAEIFFLSTDKKESTKYYYLNIIKKYITILNKKKKINFNTSIKRQNKIAEYNISNIRNLINKIKQVNNIEMLCAFYILFFCGLNFYQLSKLSYNSYSKKTECLAFYSYKFKKKILKKKKIPKQINQYFNKCFKNKRSGFLFFSDLKDEIGNSRKFQIKKIFKDFFTKKLKISLIKTKKYIEELDVERNSKRLGIHFKYLFEPFVQIIDDSKVFIKLKHK